MTEATATGGDTGADPQFALFGHPVSHSVSPKIHRQFALQTGRRLCYRLIDTLPERFAGAIADFVAGGGRGFNVTVPLKGIAFELMDTVTPHARVSGSVNTVTVNDDQTLHGDNTDGPGLIRDLADNHDVPLRGSSVLMVGAGGAARGVVAPLLDSGIEQLWIANRTHQRAVDLQHRFGGLGPIRAIRVEDAARHAWDLVINATSSSLAGELPQLPAACISPETVCYDMMYSADGTVFTRWGLANGARHAWTGTGMLVEQAALAFLQWHGIMPRTAAVIRMLGGEPEPPTR